MKQNRIYLLTFLTSLLIGGTACSNESLQKDKNLKINKINEYVETNNIEANSDFDTTQFDYFDEDNVALSFGAISDTHLDNATQTPTNLLRNTIDYLEELNGNKPLETLLIGGDLVENTYQEAVGVYTDFQVFADFIHERLDPEETSIFYTMGNHDIDPTQTKGSDCDNVPSNYYQILTANGHEGYFRHDVNKDDYVTNPASVNGNRHAVVNGYHFISISPKYFWTPANAFTEETIDWLKETLNAIVEEDATKPIFVTSHSAINNSVRLSSNEENVYSDIESILNNYPQVIYMGGHIHNIITDEYSIEQRGFTMMDLGSTKYTSTFNTMYDKNYKWANKGGQLYDNNIGTILISSGCYVQVDVHGNVKYTRFLVNEDESLKGTVAEPWIISAPQEDKSHLLRYNDNYRISKNTAPQFKENASIYISSYLKNDKNNARIVVSAAEDDQYVEYYQISLKTVFGKTIYSKNLQNFYYKYVIGNPMPEEHIFDFGEVPSGEYVIEVRAGDVWHALSEPISTVYVVE